MKAQSALAKSRLGGLGLPSWLTDWLGRDLEDVYREKYGGRYPGLAENVAVGTGTALKAVGVPRHTAETAGRNVTSLLEDWTPFGALTATEEYGPVGGLAAVPIVGAKGKKLAKGLGALKPEFSHPVSGAPYNRLTRPFEEMTSTVEPTVDILRREIDPEELYDKVFIGALGDRTAAGGRVTSVDGTELKNPVDLGGGPDYMGGVEQQNPDRLIWKSGDTVIENYAEAVRRAKEAHPGKDVVIGNILMGEGAVDFSDQMTRTVIEKMRDANMTDADLSALDAALNVRIARDAPKSPPWPGFKAIHKDPEMLERWLRSAGSGRTQIPAELEMVRWSGKLPRDIVASSRKAITEKRFLNEKTGLGGHVLGIADPEGRVVRQPLVSRADYPTGLGGTFFGNLPEGIPHHILLHDYVTGMRAKGTRSGAPVTAQHELYGIERSKPFQLIDEPQLKRIMTYLSSGKGIKLGLGGALAAGLLTEPQAEELKEKLGV